MSIDKNHVPVPMTADKKREALGNWDAEMWDVSDMYHISMQGCEGYNNMTNEEVEKLYAEHFSDE